MATIPNVLNSLSPELREKAEEMKKARGLPSLGFYEQLMAHPDLFYRVEAMGSFLRFHGSLPGKIREAVILMAAVEQRSTFEWQTHQATARAAGLTEEEIEAIGTSSPLPAELQGIRAVVRSTIGDQSVPQEIFNSLLDQFGTKCAVEIIVLAAFYRMMSGVGAAFDSRIEGNTAVAPPPFLR